mmetsp:Transcript_52809/g.140982  ORF Transcript_52809/g.140982 Transcript_52809/m.140982 type:complete len:266 (-) Transcript_52809:67-864(-)
MAVEFVRCPLLLLCTIEIHDHQDASVRHTDRKRKTGCKRVRSFGAENLGLRGLATCVVLEVCVQGEEGFRSGLAVKRVAETLADERRSSVTAQKKLGRNALRLAVWPFNVALNSDSGLPETGEPVRALYLEIVARAPQVWQRFHMLRELLLGQPLHLGPQSLISGNFVQLELRNARCLPFIRVLQYANRPHMHRRGQHFIHNRLGEDLQTSSCDARGLRHLDRFGLSVNDPNGASTRGNFDGGQQAHGTRADDEHVGRIGHHSIV